MQKASWNIQVFFELSIVVHVWKYMFQLSLIIEFALQGALVVE